MIVFIRSNFIQLLLAVSLFLFALGCGILSATAQRRSKAFITCRVTAIHDKLPPDAAVLHGTSLLIILSCNTPRKATLIRIKADQPNTWPSEWISAREVGATFRAELVKDKIYPVRSKINGKP